jgi:hypothetical protein
MTPQGDVICFVIVAEAVLESRLLAGLAGCGARGWTITAARGEGPRNRRVSEVEGGNVRVETLVSPTVAEQIWSMLSEQYFPHYAVTAWTVDVVVARHERYT